MPAGDSNTTTMGAMQPDENGIQILIKHLSSLYKKDTIQKPQIFSGETDILSHIKSVVDYLAAIEINDESCKCIIFRETLSESVRNQLIFEKEYEGHVSNFKWHEDKLKLLFSRPNNETSDIINLLSIKQQSRTIDEFVGDIKNKCIKATYLDVSSRDKIALKILLEGLDDRKIAKAVELLNPKTFQDAIKLIKSVKMTENKNKNDLFQMTPGKSSFETLQSEVQELRKQIASLNQHIIALTSRFAKNDFSKPYNTQHEKIKTNEKGIGERRNNENKNYIPGNNYKQYNSGNRYPRNTKQCFHCGKLGHISRVCRSRLANIRQMDFQNNSSVYSKTSNEHQSKDSFIDDEVSSQFLPPTISAISIKTPKQKPIDKKKPNVSYPPDIIAAEKYINGQMSKKTYASLLKSSPNCDALTVKQSSRTDIYKNKPTITGRICGNRCKIFLDSGAEINAIEKDVLLTQINVKEQDINTPRKNQIRCANGSSMEVCGEIVLPVSIGVKTNNVTFLVVRRLSPGIILGIRGLKSLGADILSSKDSVKCNGIEIPFLSTTQVDSNLGKNGPGAL